MKARNNEWIKEMKLVTQTKVMEMCFGIGEALSRLKGYGFDGADLTMTDLKGAYFTAPELFCENALKAIRETGIEIRQAHSPFPGRRYGDENYNLVYEKAVRQSIVIAARLGAFAIVVHPIACPTLSAQEQKEYNLTYFHSLEPLARENGIKIALENMWGRREGKIVSNVCSVSSEFSEYFDELDSDAFICCLDLGHFPLVGEGPQAAIRSMGDRVGALHVHDNDGISDLHQLPFFGKTNWDEVTSALAEINYCGDFTYEIDVGALAHLPSSLHPEAHRLTAAIGRYLCSEIERKKKLIEKTVYRNN